MRGDDASPPWNDSSWPFTACTVPSSETELLKSQVRDALDTDKPFGDLVPLEASALQRLEAFADTFLTFLESLEDGVVTAGLWLQVEKGLLEREKSKQSLQPEEERTQILEILCSSPPHNIAFTLITFMLSRVANELTPVDPTTEAPSTGDLSKLPKERYGQQPLNGRRSEVIASYATIFASVIIRSPEGLKDKERKGSEVRKKHIIELFVRASSEGG